MINNGLYIELPHGYEAQIKHRNGPIINNGISILNSPGATDSDLRAKICIILINLSEEDFVIHYVNRICKMVIAKQKRALWVVVDKLEKAIRGIGDFGHTGKK